jgi:uncharacterized protein Yka (UPF0111/DUF47 family)
VRLSPRDNRFYDLFVTAASNLPLAADVLLELVDAAPPDRPALAGRMHELEHAGDEATHTIMRALNTSFITPFDREDIALLTARLDDVLDYMDAAAELTVLYRIDDLPPGVRRQVGLLQRSAGLTVEAMPRLRTFRDLDSFWITLNEIENTADEVYRSLLGDLFNSGHDAVTILKVKEVVDQLEAAADAFEHLANVVQSIAAKES